ncbi:malic enzyme, NAD binding domain-containing protein [Calycina marina]|uniref:Malic enzyme n=1 Tax=Calycina marina TaxID=1763456 RepID=A0A9P7Z544_9HELO|nr:malic enzyme, NAD binding domain-containing protein [Calycina marina]
MALVAIRENKEIYLSTLISISTVDVVRKESKAREADVGPWVLFSFTEVPCPEKQAPKPVSWRRSHVPQSFSHAIKTSHIPATRSLQSQTKSMVFKSISPLSWLSGSPAKPQKQKNKFPDTSQSLKERRDYRTQGLCPPNVESHALQENRCLAQLASKKSPLEKYIYLSNLRVMNVHLFYRLVISNVTAVTPLIYTPVVGEACIRWSEIYQHPEGLYLSYSNRGSLANILSNWPELKVDITVLTDGSRILGLGDLGVNGMAIPVGKLSLYTACAGIRPERTLPLTIDLGTNNEKLLKDPLYMGSKTKRVSDKEQLEFLDELMHSLKQVWPGIVIQFEDFKNPFPSLEKYQSKYSMFNDDVQGTGAVILAGIINALKVTGGAVKDQRAVFLGAGSAGTGVAKQIVEYFAKQGLTEDEARRCFWFIDSKGLITNDRGDKLAPHKRYFSRPDNDGKQYKSLPEVMEYVKPTILMGLSTIGGAFNESILNRMAELNDRPIIFPLSNPSSQSECTFEDAVNGTDGRVVFASGSPFQTYQYKEKLYSPSQGNNMYVFPGIGLGAILSKSTNISSSMIYTSAIGLSTVINQTELDAGMLYPDIKRIREVSVVVAREVIRQAQKEWLDREKDIVDMTDDELDDWVRERMYDPSHPDKGADGQVRGGRRVKSVL